MNRHRTYRPLPPQIPADPLRGNPCDSRDPRSHVPPLKGLRETLTASVSYRASVPAGHGGCEVAPSHWALSPAADRQNGSFKALSGKGSAPATPPPFRHTPGQSRPRHTATVWRNLGRHPHCDGTFTFSAKERDPETGLSYFGSRYYSSDLSVWLSVDPMAAKYPSLSPYVYCANNPVMLVDPNGEELGDYYDLNGRWLGRDRKNDNLAYTATSVVKDESGYVISAQNKSLIPISNSELLDRATWVCGESGGSNEIITDRVQNIGDASKTLDASVAEYYAAAINNIANTKGGFYEAIKIRMSRKGPDGNIIYTSSGYFTGQPGCGNPNSRAFAKARASGAEFLNNQTRFTNSIAAVIKSVSGGSDPTNGCRAWLGGVDYAKPYVDHEDKCKPKATVQFSFESKGGYHTFYRN